MGVSRERANALLKAARDAYDPAAIAARKEADALRALVDSLDKTAAAERKVTDGQALLDKALSGGVQGVTLSEAQHRNLSKALREQHGLLEQSTGKTKLAAHEMANLSYQIQDVFVSLAGGQNPLIVLIQQGPQATSAVGGVSRAMALMLSPIGLTIAAGATLAAGLALVTSRAVGIEGQLRSLSVTTKAYGTEAQSTAAQLRDLAKSMYADGAGKDESDAAVKVISSTRGLSATMGREIAGIGNDMAAGMGKPVDEMVKQLGSLATEGYPAIKKLQDEIGFLTSDELKAVRAMAEHGQQAQALGIALEALHRRFDGLRQQSMSPAEQAFRDLGIGWNAFMDAVAQSRPVMEMITGVSGAVTRMAAAVTSTPKEQVADIETRIAAVKKSIATRDAAKGDGETYLNLSLKSLLFGTTDGSDLDKQLADLEQQLKAAQGRLVTELSKAPVRVAGTSAGAASAGGKQDEKAVQYVDEQTAAYERLAKAMGGSQAARTLEMASMRAEDEIREKKLSGQDAEDIRILRRKEALLQLSTAYGDELHSMSLATQGNILLAAAYGQGEAAALRQKAANDAQAAAAGNAAVSVAELTRQNLLNAASSTAADAAKAVADLTEQAEAQEKVADAAKLGAAAQAEAERQAQVAAQTSGILAAAQVAEEEGAAELAKTLRGLAGAYDDVSKRGVQAQRRTQGEESLRNARQSLDYARQELALMGQAEPVRTRTLRSLQIQQQAQDMAKSATSDQIAEWVKLQEQIADTQAWTQYANDVQATSKEIASSISENVYDGFTDPDKAVSVVDFFKSIFKRIAVAALEANIVLPIVTQVVGSVPSLFGIQTPTGASGAAAQVSGSGSMFSNASTLISAGRSGLSLFSGGAGLSATQAAGSFATSSMGQALGLSQSAAGLVPEAAASDMMLTSSGNALVSGAGTIGAAMPYGVIGGIGGSLIGNATGSKAAGALSGAALGAGSAGIGAGIWGLSAVGGPWGIAAAAIISGIMAALGTQKPSVGPNTSGNVTLDGKGGFRTDAALADNGADAAQMQQVTDAVATAMNAVVVGIGGRVTGGDGLNTGLLQYFAKDDKWYVTPQVGDNAGQRAEFGSQDEAIQYYMRESLKGLIGTGQLTGANDDVKTALGTSKATTAEDLASDLGFAATFRDQFDALNASMDPVSNQIKTFTEQAKELGEQVKTNITDWRDKASELGLATNEELTAAARKGIEAMMGIGKVAEPLRGVAAVTKQAEIEFEAFRPALEALGYTAADVTDMAVRYTQKAVDAYNKTIGLVQQQGAASIEQLVDPLYKMDAIDRLSSLGLDETSGVILDLARSITGVEDAARKGTLTIDDVRGAYVDVADAYVQGYLTADQLTTAVGYLTQAWADNTTVTESVTKSLSDFRSSLSSVLSSALSTAQAAATQWSGLVDKIKSSRLSLALGEYSALDPGQQLAVAQQNWVDTLTKAQAGDIAAVEALADAGEAFLKADRTVNASANPEVYYKVQAGLSSVETVAQRQLSAAQRQVNYLSSIDSSLKSLDATAARESKLSSLLASGRSWGAPESVATNLQIAMETDFAGNFGTGDLNGRSDAWIFSQPESVKEKVRQIMRANGQAWRINFETGGIVGGYEGGGLVGNGVWGRDSVLARYARGGMIALAGGEGVLTAPATAAIGADVVDYINRNHALPSNDRFPPSNVVSLRPPPRVFGGGPDSTAAAFDRLAAKIDRLAAAVELADSRAGGQRAAIGADLKAELESVRDDLAELPRRIAGAMPK
nr:phage tail length tape measure family protein [Azospirillum picis]